MDRYLIDILRAEKNEVIAKVLRVATHYGTMSWLCVPPDMADNEMRPCLVAHIDTVFDDTRRKWVARHGNRIMSLGAGLGADDRAGVYAALRLRKHPSRPLVLFTDFEETGGCGAYEATRLFGDIFERRVSFFIEIDRQGESEAVYYGRESQEFRDYINDFGFTESIGSFTDISILSGELGISGVNLSAGYYRQHTGNEYLDVAALENTIKKIKQILRFPSSGTRWPMDGNG